MSHQALNLPVTKAFNLTCSTTQNDENMVSKSSLRERQISVTNSKHVHFFLDNQCRPLGKMQLPRKITKEIVKLYWKMSIPFEDSV